MFYNENRIFPSIYHYFLSHFMIGVTIYQPIQQEEEEEEEVD